MEAGSTFQEEGALGQRRGAGGGVEEGVELGDVGDDSVGVELDGAAIGDQEAAGGDPRRLQLAAEGGKNGTEVDAAGFQIHLGPEEVDEEVAGMGLAEVEGQVGEEEGCLMGAEAGEDAVPLEETQPAEQLDAAAGIGRRAYAEVVQDRYRDAGYGVIASRSFGHLNPSIQAISKGEILSFARNSCRHRARRASSPGGAMTRIKEKEAQP